MKKPTLKQLKNRIESAIEMHLQAGWNIERTSRKITLSKMWNSSYETHTMSMREYADKHAM